MTGHLLAPLLLLLLAGTEGGVTLTGRVTDPEGRPMEGVAIWAHTRLTDPMAVLPPDARTGPDGTFEVPGLPPGRLSLHVIETGFFTEPLTVCRPGEPVQVTLRPNGGGRPLGPDGRPVAGAGLYPAVVPACDEAGRPCADCRHSIFGQVIDTAGAPIEHGRLVLLTPDAVEHSSRSFKDGIFSFDRLPPGAFRLTLEAAGYAPLHREIEPFRGEMRLVAVLAQDETCDCLPLPLRGHVLEPDGAPLEGAWVSADNTGGVLTAADGSFELHPPSREPTTVRAHLDGFFERAIPVDPAKERVDTLVIYLERGTTVTGRLLGLRKGELAFIEATREDSLANAGAKADLRRYSISDLGPGIWTITADLHDGRAYTRSLVRTVEVLPGTAEITLDLDFAEAVAEPWTRPEE